MQISDGQLCLKKEIVDFPYKNLKNWRDSFFKKFVERRMTSGIIDLDLVTYSFFYDLFDFFFCFLTPFLWKEFCWMIGVRKYTVLHLVTVEIVSRLILI